MIHLTLQGYLAGQPFCGIDKQSDLQNNPQNKFIHVPYSWNDEVVKQKMQSGELCKTCGQQWIDAGKDD